MRKEKIKDVIAGILSLLFIMIVFVLYFINLFSGNLYYQNLFREKEARNYGLTEYPWQNTNQLCILNLPKEPTIILRMDDVRAYSMPAQSLIEEIIRQNMSVTLGVMPRDLEKDKRFQNYLKKIKENKNIEIAQHGTDHNESDAEITEERLLEGLGRIQKTLGIRPVTYIFPYNNASSDSKKIIARYFRIMSGDQGILKVEGIPEVGYTVSTYDYSKNEYVLNTEIIDKCKQELERKNLCIITIHPQEYSGDITNAKTLSPQRWNNFREMLEALSELNASYSTFKELVACENRTSSLDKFKISSSVF